MNRSFILLCAVVFVFAAKCAIADFDYYVLALSWQPAFCNTHRDKPECRNQTPERFDASSLALHGLWPNSRTGASPGWCGVSASVKQLDEDKRWCDLPDIGLGRLVLGSLSTVMPGVQSCLQNHEWYRHGTCSDLGSNQYFMEASGLVHKTSSTQFNEFLARNIGKRVRVDDILKSFERDFGKGSRRSLEISCEKSGGLNYLSEIRIALNKDRLRDYPSAESLASPGQLVVRNCRRDGVMVLKVPPSRTSQAGAD